MNKNKFINEIRPLRDINRDELPETNYLLGSWLTVTSTTIVHGSEKSGKSWYSLMLAICVAGGIGAIGYPCASTPKRVIYVTTELNLAQVLKRVDCIVNSELFVAAKEDINNNLLIIDNRNYHIRLDDAKQQPQIIDAVLEAEASLIVWDNIYTRVKLSTHQYWHNLTTLCTALNQLGIATLLVAAENKKGEIFGAKSQEYFADNILRVSAINMPILNQKQICFKVNLRTMRDGDNADQLERRYLIGTNGCKTDIQVDIDNEILGDVCDNMYRVLNAVQIGFSRVKDIAREVGISESYTCKLLQALVRLNYVYCANHCYYPKCGSGSQQTKPKQDGINGPIIDL